MSIASALFKGQSTVILEKDGVEIRGKGLINKYDSKSFPEYDKGLIGSYFDPLYVYVGDCEAVLESVGETLRCKGSKYKIIKAEYIGLGETQVYVRALLEKEGS